MRKALVLIALVLLCGAAYAYDLNATVGVNDFNAIGQQILRGSFGGDPLFFGLVFLALFAITMWQANVPMGATLGIGYIIFFALSSSLGGTYTPMMMNILLLVTGILLGLAVMHYVKNV